ncbi:MAG: aspartate aminotransferase family protein [Bacteriovoracaceae bacterium]
MNEKFDNLQDLYFLGPKSEQRKFFQEMIELINNDVIFWRRNFWPKDPPLIPYRNLIGPIGQDYQDRFVQSLVQLLAELKMDVPFFSPRYIAHMTGDISLPSLIGYYAGLVFNSNNVSSEASPVTLKYELEVGRQFARLFNFDDTKSFGHITSGGTIANFESVFYVKNSRFIPATVGMGLKEKKLPWPGFLPDDAWKLLNFPLDELPQLLSSLNSFCSNHGLELNNLLQENAISQLGDVDFWKKIQDIFNVSLGHPVIIVPATAHYSWSKSANLFGIGRSNCLQVKVDEKLCMSIEHLEEIFSKCYQEKRPILETVCILGSTEFGNFDPIQKVLPLLKAWQNKGIYSPVHVDAAYGGYFKTLFMEGSLFPEIAKEARVQYEEVARIFDSIKQVDSITVDPHKLGFTPYGAGVFITKHGFSKEFIAEKADYCLSAANENDENFPLGKYILEGSKSGASATSVYFSNKIMPLNSDGYGGLLFELMKITNVFYELLEKANFLQDEFSEHFEFVPLVRPQSNLLCFFVRPKATFSVKEINSLNEKLIERFFTRPADHIQEFDYYVSKTHLQFHKFYQGHESSSLSKLKRDVDELKLVRLVFLNRWLNHKTGKGISYMEDFICKFKEECLKLRVY